MTAITETITTLGMSFIEKLYQRRFGLWLKKKSFP